MSDKSALSNIVLGSDGKVPDTDKPNDYAPVAVSASVCAGVGGIAGACTGGQFSIWRVVAGASSGAVLGVLLSLLGSKLKGASKF